jgi:hypothetical protein
MTETVIGEVDCSTIKEYWKSFESDVREESNYTPERKSSRVMTE